MDFEFYISFFIYEIKFLNDKKQEGLNLFFPIQFVYMI
jgi:hypothetical protein